MTSAAAARLGASAIAACCATAPAADIVVFDPATVRSDATVDEPRRFPDGVDTVIVNGVPVVEAGHHTGATPGRALRRGRD